MRVSVVRGGCPPPGPARRRKLTNAELGRDALDLVPGFVFHGDAVPTPLGFEARLGLARDEDLLRALSERRRLDPAEERGDLRVEFGQWHEAGHVEADHERAVGEESGTGTGRAGAGEDAAQDLDGEREPVALVLAGR